MSPPVRTAQGYHLLKLTGRRKALVRSLDEVKPQIKNRLYRDKRQQAMEDYVKKLREKANVEVHEDRLAKVAIDTSGGGSPGIARPTAESFHPGAPGAPQATPLQPGMPPGSQKIAQPPTPQVPQTPLPPSQPQP